MLQVKHCNTLSAGGTRGCVDLGGRILGERALPGEKDRARPLLGVIFMLRPRFDGLALALVRLLGGLQLELGPERLSPASTEDNEAPSKFSNSSNAFRRFGGDCSIIVMAAAGALCRKLVFGPSHARRTSHTLT